MARECVKRFGRIIMAAIVAITFAVAAFAVLVGCSKPEDGPPVDGNPSQYNVVYIAERGGHIDGDASQTVENNRDGTPVTAVADYGYTFSGWSDGVTSAERVEKNVGADVSVTARFTPIPLDVTYTAGEGGTVLGESVQTVEYGGDAAPVLAVANEADGYEFLYWSDFVLTATRNDKNVVDGISVSAIFRKREFICSYYAFDYGSIVGETWQRIEFGGSATSVTAVPASEEYEFVEWSDGVRTATRTDTNVRGSVYVVARFARCSFSVIYAAGEGGSIVGDAEQTVLYGESASTVTAMPDEGYRFVKWSDGWDRDTRGDVIRKGSAFVAIFERITNLQLAYEVEGPGYIVGEKMQYLDYGDDASPVSAVAYPGSRFVGWSDGKTSAEREDRDFKTEEKRTTVKAVFEYLSDRNPPLDIVEMRDGYLKVKLSEQCTQSEVVVPELYYGATVTALYCKNVDSVESITVPSNVKTVEIYDCPNLTELNLADGIERLTVQSCDKLKSLVLPATTLMNTGNKSIEHVTLADGTTTARLLSRFAQLKRITLPASMRTISDYAFRGCSYLTDIEFGGTVEIGAGAFMNCKSLERVTIPSGVQKIGSLAFSGCKSLAYAEFSANVAVIGERIFSNCFKLKNVVLPEGFTAINKRMFNRCGIEEIRIPDSVTVIGDGAFGNCNFLRRVYGMENVQSIGDEAFADCPLEYIILPSSLSELGKRVFAASSSSVLDVTVYSRLSKESLDALNPQWSDRYAVDVPQEIIYIGDGEAPPLPNKS